MNLYKMSLSLVMLFIAAAASGQSVNNCDQFVQQWLSKYEYAKTYRAYTCERTSLNNATLVIFGKPGTKSTDQWFYRPKNKTVLRLNPETTYGRKAQTVYRINDFSIMSESDEQGDFAVPTTSDGQKANTHEPSGDYCAVSSLGGPPVGCGLTLNDCRSVVSGLVGMSCIRR